MVKRDANGMTRYDMEWKVEGKGKVRSGRLYGLHDQEVLGARHAISLKVRRGDTVTVRVF